MSQADLARIASEITGKPLSYVAIPLETLVDNMVKAGLPRPAAEGYATFDTGTALGQFDIVSDDFETLTGHKATGCGGFSGRQREALLGG